MKEERGQPHFDYLKSSSWYHWVTIDKMSLIEVFLKTIKNFLFDLILLFLINLGDLSIVLKPDLARQVDLGPGWPGAETWPGWWKNRKSHDLVWPGKTRSKTRLQPVDFCFFFFTKTTPFWIFFKIGIDPAASVTWSKSGTRALDRARFKNYGFKGYKLV
jgi:hypothetical protein